MIHIEPEVIGFEQYIDHLVLEALEQGITTFDQLLLALPSVYPSLVVQSLERLTHIHILSSGIAQQAKQAVEHLPQNQQDEYHNDMLPIPHPLDYEWRFTRNAILRLLDLALELSASGDTIAMLGTPSVFHMVVANTMVDRNIVLVDANTSVTQYLSQISTSALIIESDIVHAQLPDIDAKVVIMDAPWYPSDICEFLQTASQICVPEGYVLASVPPVGTRPHVLEEWANLVKYAEQIHLELKEVHPLALPYISPPFERNALWAEGIQAFPLDWRRGDLAIFAHPTRSNLPLPNQVSFCREWTEETIHGVRVRVRHQEDSSFADPTLVSLLPGDILPSVSRRDTRRQLADVWTSGNRIYRCHGAHILHAILRAIVAEEEPFTMVSAVIGRTLEVDEARLVMCAVHQVKQLVELERKEIFRHVG